MGARVKAQSLLFMTPLRLFMTDSPTRRKNDKWFVVDGMDVVLLRPCSAKLEKRKAERSRKGHREDPR